MSLSDAQRGRSRDGTNRRRSTDVEDPVSPRLVLDLLAEDWSPLREGAEEAPAVKKEETRSAISTTRPSRKPSQTTLTSPVSGSGTGICPTRAGHMTSNICPHHRCPHPLTNLKIRSQMPSMIFLKSSRVSPSDGGSPTTQHLLVLWLHHLGYVIASYPTSPILMATPSWVCDRVLSNQS
ncbi:hypothetical protein RRG08_060176 [Elysia crispata]|uniref:Uncharacterized protein n=1 Tax=Elysia crispata TaxID=231223 RepID=A0AAE0ZZ67_9GAST|nr:hypothetical protein RRG08_060176 [Elysia crispata]